MRGFVPDHCRSQWFRLRPQEEASSYSSSMLVELAQIPPDTFGFTRQPLLWPCFESVTQLNSGTGLRVYVRTTPWYSTWLADLDVALAGAGGWHRSPRRWLNAARQGPDSRLA
jgi:hypothetical protein